MHKTTMVASRGVRAGLTAAPAHAQLASRPAAEWKATLEAPARVEGLKIEQVVAALKLKAGDVVADLGRRHRPLRTAARVRHRARPRLRGGDRQGVPRRDRSQGGRAPHRDHRDRARYAHRSEAADAQPSTSRLMHDVLHHVEQRQAYLKAVAQYSEADRPHRRRGVQPEGQPAQGRPGARRVEGAGRGVDGRGRLRARRGRRVVSRQVVRDLQTALRRSGHLKVAPTTDRAYMQRAV